ncbi:MAG: class I tRNA ligase family protein, partial [Candidatus Bathyarchaeia archaeon]
CITRSRIWGSPLNIWRCEECKAIRVVDSRRELQQLAIKMPRNLQLHRPWIDEVVLKCESCAGTMNRVPFVLDCWLDSGVAHAASVNYLRDPRLFKELFPYDFVTEAVDQTRGWFYSLLATATIAFDSAPYRNVLCQGHVLDKFGQKMSKSKGNVVWAEQLLEKHGADVLRMYLLSKAAPGDALVFDEDELDQTKRSLGIVWNIFAFSTTYMTLDGFNPNAYALQNLQGALRFEDKWLLSRCQGLIDEISKELESFRLHKASRALLDFAVEDISRLYIRLIRRRTWIESEREEKTAAYWVLNYALSTLVKLMAPFAPHLAEELHEYLQNADSPESIHFQSWPSVNTTLRDTTAERDMDVCRDVARAGLAARQKGQLKLRWPVKLVSVLPSTPECRESLQRTVDVLLSLTNAKEVTILGVGEKPSFIRSVANPKYAVLGRRFKALAPKVAAALSMLDAEKVMQNLSVDGFVNVEVEGEKHRVTADMVEVKEILPEHISSEVCASGIVFVDTTRTRDLLSESVAREIVRRAQIMRKEMQLKIDEYVDVDIQPQEMETHRLIEEMKDYITSEVRIRHLRLMKPQEKPPSGVTKADIHPPGLRKEWELEGETITIDMRKVA